MNEFLSEDFLLESKTASRLYHDFAASMPIYDFHTHLSPEQIAENRQFRSISQLWLEGDHYKWRLMRANGIEERCITGDASEREKFSCWLKTLPLAVGNPVFHWSYMELKNPFGITDIEIGPRREEEIWRRCNERIASDDLRPQGILDTMRVNVLCTTDDPVDSLEHHAALFRSAACSASVVPTFRPDCIIVEKGREFAAYLERLAEAAGTEIKSFASLIDALDLQHRRFHEQGCRISDHALDNFVFHLTSPAELEQIMDKKRQGRDVTPEEEAGFATAVLLHVGRMNVQRGWAMQLHIGALRDVNAKQLKTIGRNSGFDAIRGGLAAVPLARFFDLLDQENSLPKTVVYPLDPGEYDTIAALIGCFQSAPVPGKIQFGPAWWFNDHKEGIVRQLEATAVMGLLGRFIGMVTDSRSFLSFPRHEYFRRILCNLIGNWVEKGELSGDFPLLGGMIQDICYNNAARYFAIAK